MRTSRLFLKDNIPILNTSISVYGENHVDIYLDNLKLDPKYIPTAVNIPIGSSGVSYPSLMIHPDYFHWNNDGEIELKSYGKFPRKGYIFYNHIKSWQYREIDSEGYYKRQIGQLKENRLVEHRYVPAEDGVGLRKILPGENPGIGSLTMSSLENVIVGIAFPLSL